LGFAEKGRVVFSFLVMLAWLMNDPAIQSVLSAQNSAVQNQIDVAVAKKQLSAVKQQGEAMVELLQAAAAIGKAVGRGANFDGQA
jgi:hypothetical protein